jgi:hypothetical protein
MINLKKLLNYHITSLAGHDVDEKTDFGRLFNDKTDFFLFLRPYFRFKKVKKFKQGDTSVMNSTKSDQEVTNLILNIVFPGY